MSKVFGFASLSVLMTIGLMMTGCSGQQPSAPSATAQNQSVAVGHERQGSGHGGHQQGEPDYAEQIPFEAVMAQLSADDRALAEKQGGVCPVSGELLGSRGKPFKVTANGQEALLCCQKGEAKFKENPAKYLPQITE